MRKTAQNFLKKTGYMLIAASRKIHQSTIEKNIQSWMKADGDKTLRLNYDLNEHSIVFDVGGYEGQWTSDIYAKYNCHIHVFEPVKNFANHITKRFEKNKKIIVHNIGLGSKTKQVNIAIDNDASSLHKTGSRYETIHITDISAFIKQHNIHTIDLMKINIEGAEYELLERLIQKNLLGSIKNIQVQFHEFVPHAKEKMQNIQSELQKTHVCTYTYPFIWENWTRRT